MEKNPRINSTRSRRYRLAGIGVVGALLLSACSLPDGLEISTGGGGDEGLVGPPITTPTTVPTETTIPAPISTETTIPAPEFDPTSEIDSHIATLSYRSDDNLDVQEIPGGAPNGRQAGEANQTEEQQGNTVRRCVSTPYNLRSNFSEVAILRPTNGVVFPGALVKADSSLLDGTPTALGIPQGPVALSIDLPGIGDNGVLYVDNPSNSSVQAAVDGALDWWNRNAYIDGYVNPSNSSYQYKTAYSSQQAALDVGLNVAWATGDFAGHLSVDTSSEKRTTVATFKQAFYTVSLDTPSSPAAMIADSVAPERAIAALTAENAPAYVASVVYGRILMVRMESSRDVTAAEAEAALNYAAGVKVEGQVNARYDQILEQSELEVITVGGNAAVQAQLIDPSTLPDVIQGKNALYSVDNPGVPIAYSVHNLHDNSLAKLGYTTDYTATECTEEQVGGTVKVTLVRFQAVRDCDGIEGDGDFTFSAAVRNRNGNTFPDSRVRQETILGDGDYVNVLREVYFDVDWEQGEEFTVSFTGSEADKVFGSVRNDERMSGASNTRTHSYNEATNTWSNNDPQSTGLGGRWPSLLQLEVGSGNCRAELHYHIEFL